MCVESSQEKSKPAWFLGRVKSRMLSSDRHMIQHGIEICNLTFWECSALRPRPSLSVQNVIKNCLKYQHRFIFRILTLLAILMEIFCTRVRTEIFDYLSNQKLLFFRFVLVKLFLLVQTELFCKQFCMFYKHCIKIVAAEKIVEFAI